MQKRVLITGISGFAGSHLAEYFVKKDGYDIFGTYLTESSLSNLNRVQNDINLIRIDLSKTREVFDLIKLIKPDLLFHLAALSSPADSIKNPVKTFSNNVEAQINILEAIKELGLKEMRILIISSADVYGAVSRDDLPIDEKTRFVPTNTYAVSKIAQDFLGLQYNMSYNLKIIRARPFNHIGPRQSDKFVVASFAKRIAEIEKYGKEKILFVGNLHPKRDFTDVRDMVLAYALLIEKGKMGEVYNIGSGKSYAISEILNKLLVLSKVKLEVRVDTSLLRPNDTDELLCDSRKFNKLTGWEPIIPIEKTIEETLDYWRAIV